MAPAKSFISPCLLPIFVSTLFLGFVLSPSAADNVLYSGRSLYPGQSLVQGNYSLIMQYDCNLVLYYGTQPLWASQTYGQGHRCIAYLRTGGDLVVYNTDTSRPIWESGTRRYYPGKYVLILQPNGDVVIYGSSLWATGTRFYRANNAVKGMPTMKAALPTVVPPVTVVKAEEGRKAGDGEK